MIANATNWACEVGGKAIFTPTAQQSTFFEAISRYDYLLYGGAAGGGKSSGLRWGLILMLAHYGRAGLNGVRVGLFCEDYPSLRDRHLSRLAFEVPRELGIYSDSVHELRLNPALGGGVLAFRNLDDPSKYLSAEFACVAVDELTRNPEQTFSFLRSRMRWPRVDRPKFLAASNPGGTGHAWVKRLWIDRDFPPEMASLAPQFCYIPAKASDNPHLSPSYYESLKTLPPQLARAYAEGDWDIFAGQKFTEWRREVHTCKPFAIPPHWRRWIGNDPGFTDPGCWGWYAASEDGRVVKYREMTFRRVTYSDQAKAVKAAGKWRDELGREQEEVIEFVVTGMDAFVQDPDSGKGPADYYREAGLGIVIEPDHGAGCRARGAATLHEYLRVEDGEDGKPRAKLLVFDTCREFIRTLPTLVSDEHDPEAVADSGDDHTFDESRYALQAWHARRSVKPDPPMYQPGTAGDILRHAEKLGAKKKGAALD